jgi:hypothetical protein
MWILELVFMFIVAWKNNKHGNGMISKWLSHTRLAWLMSKILSSSGCGLKMFRYAQIILGNIFFFLGGSPYSEIYRGGPDFNLFSYTYRIRHPSALNTMVPTCFPHKTSQFFPLTLTRCTSVAAPFGRHGQCSAPLKVPHLLAAPWEIWHGTWELCKISIADWSS